MSKQALKKNNPSVNEHGNSIIDVGKALKLRLVNNLSYQQIANQVFIDTGHKIDKTAVFKRLKPFERLIKDPEAIQAYESNKEDLLSAVEMKLLVEMLNTSKLKSASLNNVAYAFQQIFNANRLQRDKSTANLSVRSVIEDIKKRREELQSQVVDNQA